MSTTILAPTAQGLSSLFSNILLLTIGLIFIVAIISTVIVRRRRDRCLKLLHDYHVTMEMANGKVIWGDLRVFPQGLQVEYDAPYQTELGLVKSGYLLYQSERESMLALSRYVGDLTAEELAARRRQVLKRFRPGFLRRFGRGLHNLFNTIRDAFGQSLSALVGHVAKVGGAAMAAQKGRMEQLGQSLLGAVGNAYEPMLERHIGKPIILELASPADPDKRKIELAGYLAEYSDTYLAMFNVEQAVGETLVLSLEAPVERDDLRVEVDEHRIAVTNLHDVPLVVRALDSDSGERRDLGVVLTNAATAGLARIPGVLSLELLRVHRIDVVCPRAHAVVRYASLDELPADARHNLPPAHEDRRVAFP
jgi:hypothetical protein